MFEKPSPFIENKEQVDIKNLKPGMSIKIRQPAGKVYDTNADADVGYGGVELSETWHDTVITEVNIEDDEPYIETEQFVRLHSYIFNRFHAGEIFLKNGVLIADPK